MSTDINKITSEFKKITTRLKELEFEISFYYTPIIDKLVKEKDLKKLDDLLCEIPEGSLVKLQIYQAKREIKENK